MHPRLWDTRPLFVDVALPVGHHRDAGRLRQHRLRRLGRRQPALGLLVSQRPLVVRALTRPARVHTRPRPDPAPSRPRRRHPPSRAATVPGLIAQPRPAPDGFRTGLEDDLAQVLIASRWRPNRPDQLASPNPRSAARHSPSGWPGTGGSDPPRPAGPAPRDEAEGCLGSTRSDPATRPPFFQAGVVINAPSTSPTRHMSRTT